MLKCECDRCHSAMDVPLSTMPFMMPNPNEKKLEFIIFRNTENNQMEQLHLCPSCEKAFESFLDEVVNN